MRGIASFLRGFKFTSEVQEKGFNSMVQYLNGFKGRFSDQDAVWAALAYLIQKDHESHEYYIDLFGKQVADLQDQIKQLQDQIKDLTETEVVQPAAVKAPEPEAKAPQVPKESEGKEAASKAGKTVQK